MNSYLRVLQAGPGVTLQDSGRWGYLRFGVTAAGPMDVLAHEAANLAAGEPEGAAAIEISVGGLDVSAEDAPIGLAIVAAGFRVSLDGTTLPTSCAFALLPGQLLSVRAGSSGSWAYLAVSGRFDALAELGSLSMHVRSGVGGRGLKAGDRLHIVQGRAGPAQARGIAPIRDEVDMRPIRIVPGPQDDYFDPENIARFLAGPWRISSRSDRMAYSLEGPRIMHARGFNIVSDGIAFGAIQIPGDGAPFVQMADRAPTGGYPKIGTVIAADLGRLAQMRPRASLTFEAVAVDAAVAAWREARGRLEGAVRAARSPSELSSEELLASNLVSGVTSAHAPPGGVEER